MKLTSLIKKYILNENDGVHSYGCVMLFLECPQMSKIQSKINPDHLYIDPNDDSYGIEKECHISLLYGTHEGVTLKDVNKALVGIKFGNVLLQNPSLFQNDKYDVLKYDVGNPVGGTDFLWTANIALKKLPYTSDYPDYHPHMTVAYLKSGYGQRYADMLNKTTGMVVRPTHLVYSEPDGTKTRIEL